MLVMAGNEKEGGYGQSTGTGIIKTYSSYATQNSQLLRFRPKGDVLFNREETFFIIDANKRSHKARWPGILKVYSRHKKAVEQYLKEQPVDFRQEEDLKKLLGFCAQLLQ